MNTGRAPQAPGGSLDKPAAAPPPGELADASGRLVGEPAGGLAGVGAGFSRLREYRVMGLLAVYVVILVAGALLNDRFAELNNFSNIAAQASTIGIVTIGATFVIMAGGIDLSVGSVLALASVVGTERAVQGAGWPAMVLVTVLVALAAGAINGLLIAYGRVVAFIATLAMFASARGLALRITESIPNIVGDQTFKDLAIGRLLGVPAAVYIFALVAVAGWVLLNRTTFGRRTVAIGGNAEASRLAGIDVKRHTVLLYVLSGLCVGIAAVLLSGRIATGSASSGEGYELDAIAAVIIGGTALSGGRGTMVGSILGILILTTLTNIFTLLQFPADIRQIATGIIIVGAVLLQGRQRADG